MSHEVFTSERLDRLDECLYRAAALEHFATVDPDDQYTHMRPFLEDLKARLAALRDDLMSQALSVDGGAQ